MDLNFHCVSLLEQLLCIRAFIEAYFVNPNWLSWRHLCHRKLILIIIGVQITFQKCGKIWLLFLLPGVPKKDQPYS